MTVVRFWFSEGLEARIQSGKCNVERVAGLPRFLLKSLLMTDFTSYLQLSGLGCFGPLFLYG